MAVCAATIDRENPGSNSFRYPDAVVAALLSGGDSRTAIDVATGTNKYLCPPRPAPDLACFASCTASPIGVPGFDRAAAAFRDIAGAASPQLRAQRMAWHAERVESALLGYFTASGLADVVLCASGTDALLAAALLLATERPNQPMTALLPVAGETGTGIKLAARGRQFDGPGAGRPLCDTVITTVEIKLRDAAGAPLAEAALDAAYAAAAAAAESRPVVYLTHGTKTGLIAPATPPSGCDVIVDACQSRIAPAQVAASLRRGWPVAVTGSKFFGGPAFSGALLLPRGGRDRRDAASRLASHNAAGLGTILRWTAAAAVMEAFAARAGDMAALLHERAVQVAQSLAGSDCLVHVGGLPARGEHWADMSSIHTIAVRDPADRARRLSHDALRPHYRSLARAGILVGQPVDLGSFGGLRIAVGARDLVDTGVSNDIARLFAVLTDAVAGRA